MLFAKEAFVREQMTNFTNIEKPYLHRCKYNFGFHFIRNLTNEEIITNTS